MSSLRRRLTLSLWVALGAVGMGSAVLSYFVALEDANSLLDYQMQEIARFLAAQSFTVSAPAAVLPRLDLNHDADDDFVVTVRDSVGQVLYASREATPLPTQPWLGLRTLRLPDGEYRMFSGQSGGLSVLVAQQMQARHETGAAAAASALLPIALILPVLGLIIGIVIRRQLLPLGEIAREVSRRPALAFDPLPATQLPTEVQPLIEQINRLLVRLQWSLQHEQRFIADAAHSLRTPLTALQLQADVLNGSGDAHENAIRLTQLRAGIRRTVRLSDHLLALAVSESSVLPVHSGVALDAAVRECYDLYQPTAEARGIRLVLQADSDAVVAGDERHFALLVGNLLDNALRYTPAGGEVSLTTRREGDAVLIEVVDDGPGLPEAELEKVFDRFYRAANDPTEGSGLGLAVVRGLALRLGGKVRLQNRSDRHGLVAQLRLPCLATDSDRPATSAE